MVWEYGGTRVVVSCRPVINHIDCGVFGGRLLFFHFFPLFDQGKIINIRAHTAHARLPVAACARRSFFVHLLLIG